MDEKNLTKTYIQLLGVRVYCEYQINGKPPILLIHGFVSSTYTFHRLIPLLLENFSVIAIDLPGFGRSEKSLSFTYSYRNYAKLVKACLDYFQLDTAILGGHSMGGQISLNTALRYPERINKIILFASSGYLPRHSKWLRRSSYLPFFHLMARREIKKNGVVENLQSVLYDHTYINEQLIEEYRRPIQDKNFAKSLVRLLRHREGDLTTEQLQTIITPALLLWGKEDKVVSLKTGRRLARELPNAILISYKETGHLLTEERPYEINQAIQSFIFPDP